MFSERVIKTCPHCKEKLLSTEYLENNPPDETMYCPHCLGITREVQ